MTRDAIRKIIDAAGESFEAFTLNVFVQWGDGVLRNVNFWNVCDETLVIEDNSDALLHISLDAVLAISVNGIA